MARRLQGLPVEAIVRGYLIGSGWKDYQRTGQICGIPLPPDKYDTWRVLDLVFDANGMRAR